MKLIVRFLILLLFLASAHQGFGQDSIKLASGEWIPYQSQHLKHGGVISHIITEAFASEGIKVELGYFPWKRSLHIAEVGQLDGTFVWFETEERRRLFYFSEPVVDINYVFFHKKSTSFDWKSIKDLKGLRIGGTLGYDYGTEYQQAEEQGTLRVIRKSSDAINFQRLLDGKIEIFPCDIEVGYEIIRDIFDDEKMNLFTHHPFPLKKAPHYLLLSKKNKNNQNRMVLFNKGLLNLKKSGIYDNYINQSRQGMYKP